jgi:2-haloalkanoic acid dehalogenase type II
LQSGLFAGRDEVDSCSAAVEVTAAYRPRQRAPFLGVCERKIVVSASSLDPAGSTSFDAEWIGGEPKVLVFDVNETLIDFESMNPLFHRIFGDAHVLREWLGHLVMYSMTITLSGLHKDYYSLGGGLLRMVGDIHGVAVSDADANELREGMKTMPAHPDVAEGLGKLKDAGFRLISLTNSPNHPEGESPLDRAGLGQFIERQFSIETALSYKPAPQVYHMVSQDPDGRRSRLGHCGCPNCWLHGSADHPTGQQASAPAWAPAAEHRHREHLDARRRSDCPLALT